MRFSEKKPALLQISGSISIFRQLKVVEIVLSRIKDEWKFRKVFETTWSPPNTSSELDIQKTILINFGENLYQSLKNCPACQRTRTRVFLRPAEQNNSVVSFKMWILKANPSESWSNIITFLLSDLSYFSHWGRRGPDRLNIKVGKNMVCVFMSYLTINTYKILKV